MMQLSPGQRFGKYTTIRYVGSGAFGSVYLMHDDLMNRDCAVKFVENDDPNSFVAHFEAQILNQCRHERIVSVNSVDVVSDPSGAEFAAIEMEFIAGGSAADMFGSHVPIRRAIKIVIDTLFALEHAHRQNILHRDVKPSNIMLVHNRARLTDFGLATDGSAALTASGAGSPVYCAPEVINDGITNATTDVFSAGITLFQLANNYRNFAARISSLDPIRLGRVIPSIGYRDYVPRRLRMVCNKACAPDPARRYQSAREFRQALETLHVKEDWVRVAPGHWRARIRNQIHELLAESGPPSEFVYTVNNRRRNANSTRTGTPEAASRLATRWVYDHTF